MTGLKRTKIIATLGPATDKPGVLDHMIAHGMDLARLNFSHGSTIDHQRRLEQVRQCAANAGREIGIIADLQGPKIRISTFKNKKVTLKQGATFTLDASLGCDEGTEESVGIDYKELIHDVYPKDILLLDDGRLILQVEQVVSPKINCVVLVGGELSNNKGINRQGGGLSAKFLTDKDLKDMKTAVELGADYIAVSFPRSAEDIHEAKAQLQALGGKASIIAKIERTEAVSDIDNIIQACDAVMVARGDLGVEIGDAELPSVQKMIIHKARSYDRAVITATQMMESMITNTIPTRAEVFDVANAILDGTDAVMLSAETATGAHPDKVIETVARICLSAEKHRLARTSGHRMECQFNRVDEAIAMAVMYTANHMEIKAIISLTESGSTPLWMSRIRSGIPIYGLSRNVLTQRKMTLFRGVYPIHFDVTHFAVDDVNHEAIAQLKRLGIIATDDLVILTKGDAMGVHGGTNTLKIIRVNDITN